MYQLYHQKITIFVMHHPPEKKNDVCDINNDMCDNLIMHHKYGDNLMSKAGFVNYDYG